MKNITQQKGYLLIVATAMIVIISAFVAAIVHMFTGSSDANINDLSSKQAIYLAESGIERAKHLFIVPNLTNRVTCNTVTNNANLTNVAFGRGVFSVTGDATTYVNSPATLTATISSTATTLPVNTATGYAPFGRILIDKEAIDYSGTSTSSCNGAPACFVGVVRGANHSLASTHVIGAKIAQYQCQITSTGGVSNLTNPLGKYSVTAANIYLQEAWAVGEKSVNNMTFIRWGYPTANQWNNDALDVGSAKANLNDISLLNYAEGWVVGDERNNNFTIRRWDSVSDSWVVSPGIPSNGSRDLYGVSAVSTNEVWAVGKKSGDDDDSSTNYTIVHWNGSTWCVLSPGGNSCSTMSIPSGNARDLSDVSVVDSTGNSVGNIGFAVGNNGHILKYNGSNWSLDTSPTNTHLTGVSVISPNEAWAVGNNGTLLRWNGSSWSTQTSPTSAHLNGIYMLDINGDNLADSGLAVGDSGSTIYYNGSTWTSYNAGGNNLHDVTLFSSDDAWAVGDGGRTTHWDGSAWTDFSSSTSQSLYGISKVGP